MHHHTRAHIHRDPQKSDCVNRHIPRLRYPSLDTHAPAMGNIEPYPRPRQQGHHTIQRQARENEDAASCKDGATRAKECVRADVARPRAARQDGDTSAKEKHHADAMALWNEIWIGVFGKDVRNKSGNE